MACISGKTASAILRPGFPYMYNIDSFIVGISAAEEDVLLARGYAPPDAAYTNIGDRVHWRIYPCRTAKSLDFSPEGSIGRHLRLSGIMVMSECLRA